MEYIKLKDLFTIKKGNKVELSEKTNSSMRYIQIDDLRNDNNIKYCNYNKKYIIATENDVIIAWDGANAGTIGFGKSGAIGSTLALLKIKNEDYNTKYCGMFLKGQSKYLRDNCTGATIPHISRSCLENLQIPKLTINEQIKIVNALDKAQELIDKREEQIKFLDRLVKSKFIEMFGDLVLNKKSWEIQEINKVCLEIVDCVNRTAPIVEYKTKYKMIRTTNVKSGKINLQGCNCVSEETYNQWTRRLVPKIGDILFTREAPTGECGLIETEEKVFLGQRIMQYRVNDRLVNSIFLTYHLLDDSIKLQINKLATDSTVKHLSVNDCKKFLVKIPPIELQNQFADFVKQTDKLKFEMQNSLKELEYNFNSLMQKAFMGELFKEN